MQILNKNISIEKSINYIILAYAFTLPLSRATISISTALLFLLWLFDKDLKERFFLSMQNKVILSVTLFIFFSALSLLWSGNPLKGILELKHYWFLLPIFVLATNIKPEQIPKIISAFLLGMLISEILSYGIFFQLWTFGHGTPQDPSPIMHHIHYSVFLAVTSLLLLNRFYFEKEIKWKIFYFIYFIFTTSNLFINGGRTGQLAYILGIIVVALVNIKNKVMGITIILFLGTTIIVTAYNVSPNFHNKILQTSQSLLNIKSENSKMYQTSFGARLAAWEIGMEIFKNNPIIGVGIGSEMDALKHEINTNMTQFKNNPLVYNIPHYHNSYIGYLVQLGSVGLVLFLSIFYNLLKLPVKDKELRNLKYIFITVFMVACFFEQMFKVEFPLALFALFVGIFSAVSHSSKKSIQ